MGGNFKFQVQDSFLEYCFFEIWRSKKRIALSEKKPPLEALLVQQADSEHKKKFPNLWYPFDYCAKHEVGSIHQREIEDHHDK